MRNWVDDTQRKAPGTQGRNSEAVSTVAKDAVSGVSEGAGASGAGDAAGVESAEIAEDGAVVAMEVVVTGVLVVVARGVGVVVTGIVVSALTQK
jgi:hypothetical protein